MSDNPDSLITAASIMAGFGSIFFAFRLERELHIADENRKKPIKEREITWIAFADWMLILAIIVSLVAVVVPLVSPGKLTDASLDRARAACAAAAVMIAGYIPSILAHYNFIRWLDKSRTNPTPLEGLCVFLTLLAALLVYLGHVPWW